MATPVLKTPTYLPEKKAYSTNKYFLWNGIDAKNLVDDLLNLQEQIDNSSGGSDIESVLIAGSDANNQPLSNLGLLSVNDVATFNSDVIVNNALFANAGVATNVVTELNPGSTLILRSDSLIRIAVQDDTITYANMGVNVSTIGDDMRTAILMINSTSGKTEIGDVLTIANGTRILIDEPNDSITFFAHSFIVDGTSLPGANTVINAAFFAGGGTLTINKGFVSVITP
jgi:hypothetical protein